MKKPLITLMLILYATLATAAFAEQALVPQSGSGQVLCYDAAGVDIPCTGTGQDGELQLGILWPTPRFTDNGNGTITDNLTGLIWLRNAGCYSGSWTTALNSANTLANGACGLTDGTVAGDWRLPNRKELESLVNRRQANGQTWLNSVGFSNVQPQYYWSSTTYAPSSGSAYIIYFGNAFGYTSATGKSSSYYAWPVRGGQ